MRPRILLNLVAFAVLGVVLCIWALTSIVTVDAIKQPFTVKAEFASSPGLRPDLEVTYLGVRVGSVHDVKLSTGKVVVTLHLNKGVEVPSNAGAAVLRKSAVGEPYIDLSPPAAAPARSLHGGDLIPLSRTTVAVDYKELFDAAGTLLKAVDPDDAKTLVHELSVGLAGRDTTLRDIVGDAHQLTGTLADNAQVLDQLSEQLTQLTGLLADNGPQLANGVDGLASFITELSNDRAKLDSILANGPGFLKEVNALLNAARPGLSCLLTALGTPAPSVFTPQATQELAHSLGLLTENVPTIVKNAIVKDGGHDWAKVTFALVGAGPVPAAKEYPEPLKGADIPDLYYCTKAYDTDDLKTKTENAGDQKQAAPAQAAGPFTEVKPPAEAKPAAEHSPLGRWVTVLPIVLAAVILLLTARRTLRVVRRRDGS